MNRCILRGLIGVRFGICSEDGVFRASLRHAIQVWSAGVCADMDTCEWPDWPSCLEGLGADPCELLFLDADSACMHWDEIARQLNGACALFVCSDSSHAAIDCYALHPRGFLTKQVTAESLERSLYPCFGLWRKALACLNLSIGRNRVSLPVCELLWADARGRSCVLHSSHGQITVNDTLQELTGKLPPALFFRCQKSFVVNLRHIRAVSGGMLVMSDGAQVPVGRNCKSEVQQAYAAFRRAWTLRHPET